MKLLQITKILILTLLSIAIFSTVILAGELSIEEAIELGLANSSQINEARESVRQVERSLAVEVANNDWQLVLSGEYDYVFDKDEDYKGLSISIGKSFLSGFEIKPSTGISIDDKLDSAFSISVSQPLYPQLPTELAQNQYKAEKDLLKARRNLTEVKIDSILNWIDTYLNIKRMVANRDIYLETVKKAEDNLAEVLARQEIGDVGKNEILTAELSLENARYSLKEAENQLEDARYSLSMELGFSPGEEIIIIDNNHYIDNLRSKAQEYLEEYLKKDITALMSIVEENNNDLKANLIDRAVLEQELTWLKEGNKPGLDLNGSYNTTNDELTLGISLSYQLYDSGQHRIALEEKERELADNLKAYDELYNQLNQELKQQLDKLELAQMAVQKGELSLARSQYQLDVAEKQLKMGLIDYLEYQDYWIATCKAEIEIEALEDQLFLAQLEFIKFINQNVLDEMLGGV
jgi:outer membrane protein TolC